MTDEQKPVDLLETQEQEGVVYINPHIEINLSDAKRHECREIVREIKNFGVNQRQILFLIELLALELEDIHTGKDLRKVIIAAREKMKPSSSHSSSLILPEGSSL